MKIADRLRKCLVSHLSEMDGIDVTEFATALTEEIGEEGGGGRSQRKSIFSTMGGFSGKATRPSASNLEERMTEERIDKRTSTWFNPMGKYSSSSRSPSITGESSEDYV
jgi:dTDP-4-dehydrorhamnose reductase